MTVSSSSPGGIKGWLETYVLQGQPLTSELAAILLVYFVQGILGLARLAVSFFLKDDLGLTPAEVGALTGIATLPWTIKPLFGFISDGLPIFGYRFVRPYLMLSGNFGGGILVSFGYGGAVESGRSRSDHPEFAVRGHRRT